MKIGTVAKMSGVGIETIRFYEKEGLLESPQRTNSGYREYSSDIVSRLNFIRTTKELGFSLKEIKELLSLRARTKSKCGSVKRQAETKIKNIENKIVELNRIKQALEQLVISCRNEEASIASCPILEALEGKENHGGQS